MFSCHSYWFLNEKSVSRSGLCPSFVQTGSSPILSLLLACKSQWCQHVTVVWWSSMLLKLHYGNTLPVELWYVPRSPLALLLSAVAALVFQAASLFQQWLITVLMRCEGCRNVTRMTWACQCGPEGRSVSHTDIWKDTEHQPLAAFKERTSYYLSWNLLVLCNTILTYSICLMVEWVQNWCHLLSLYWLNEM